LFYWNSIEVSRQRTGTRVAAAIDVQTGRELWYRKFDGELSSDQNHSQVALSSIDTRTGLMKAEFVRSKTTERILTIPGEVIAFSSYGDMALVRILEGLSDNNSAPAKLRLVEVIGVRSFASDSSQIRGVHNQCHLPAVPFERWPYGLARIWNRNDWYFVSENRISRTYAKPANELSEKSRLSYDEAVRLFPEYETFLKRGEMEATEYVASGRRFVFVADKRGSQDENKWRLYRISAKGEEIIATGNGSNGAVGKFLYLKILMRLRCTRKSARWISFRSRRIESLEK
jgi:hypothetical protein